VTYRVFLAAVLAPQVAAAAALFAARLASAGPERRRGLLRGLILVAVLVVVAVGYTMPWDHWLILHAVWSYPPGSVLGTVGRVPVEEYLFMIGQTLTTGWWALVVAAQPEPRRRAKTSGERGGRRRALSCAGWLVAAAGAAAFAAADGHGLYLAAILVWYAPLLALQAAAGADALRRARGPRLAGLAPTLLLWASDAVAIDAGAWRIGAAHTVGVSALGLPLEEALFFLVTNLLVVDSVILLADDQVRTRLTRRSLSARPDAAGPRRGAIGICEQSEGVAGA
jgi:lycopene cyclase domain-containing protein